MNKRGISGILVTVLLVLLAIGALGIIWVILLSFINSGSESIDLNSNTLKVEVVENSLKYLPGDSLELLVRRDANLGNISGVKVVIDSEGGNSYSVDANVNLDVLESKKIIVPLNGKIDKITKVSVYPLISNGKKSSVGKLSDDEAVGSGFVSSEGLVLYLPFDGDMLDKSGYGNNGSCTGNSCPSSSAGKIGNAYSYDGVDDYVLMPYTNSLYLSGKNETLILWVKPITNGAQILWQNNHWSRRLYYDSSNKFYATLIDTSGLPSQQDYHFPTSSFSSTVNEWHFVGYTVRDNLLILYVDGKVAGTDSTNYPLYPADQLWRFGSSCTGNCFQFYPGSLDEIRLYNRSLSQQEIYYLYKYN